MGMIALQLAFINITIEPKDQEVGHSYLFGTVTVIKDLSEEMNQSYLLFSTTSLKKL